MSAVRVHTLLVNLNRHLDCINHRYHVIHVVDLTHDWRAVKLGHDLLGGDGEFWVHLRQQFRHYLLLRRVIIAKTISCTSCINIIGSIETNVLHGAVAKGGEGGVVTELRAEELIEEVTLGKVRWQWPAALRRDLNVLCRDHVHHRGAGPILRAGEVEIVDCDRQWIGAHSRHVKDAIADQLLHVPHDAKTHFRCVCPQPLLRLPSRRLSYRGLQGSHIPQWTTSSLPRTPAHVFTLSCRSLVG